MPDETTGPPAAPLPQGLPPERGVVVALPTQQRGVILGGGNHPKPPTGRVVTVESISFHKAREEGPPLVVTSRSVRHTRGAGGGYAYDLEDISHDGIQLGGLPLGDVDTVHLENRGTVDLLLAPLGGDPLARIQPGRSARWQPYPNTPAVVYVAAGSPAAGKARVTLFPA